MTFVRIVVVAVVTLFSLAGCSRREDRSPAREAGRAAYDLTEKSKKAAKAASRELGHAAREAHEGWKEARREHKASGGK